MTLIELKQLNSEATELESMASGAEREMNDRSVVELLPRRNRLVHDAKALLADVATIVAMSDHLRDCDATALSIASDARYIRDASMHRVLDLEEAEAEAAATEV